MISREEIKKIAGLSRIDVSEADEEKLALTISQVLDYVNILKEVDTREVKITSQVTGLTDVLREDIPSKSPVREELMATMPEVTSDELSVPGVFNDK